jgi:hypothetical protein
MKSNISALAISGMFLIAIFSGCVGNNANFQNEGRKAVLMEYNYPPQAPPLASVAFSTGADCKLTETVVQGNDPIDAYVLENEYLYLTIMQGWGAKVYQCIFKPTGHDFAWKNDYARLLDPTKETEREGLIWQEYEIGGFDDCLPTVGGCNWNGRYIPDHGEAWLDIWTVDDVKGTADSASIKMSCTLESSPFMIEKTLTLFRGESRYLRHYKITNIGNSTEEFMWADHASINPGGDTNEGDRIYLPTGTGLMVYASNGNRMGERGNMVSWPIATTANGESTDLNFLGSNALMTYEKYFTLPLSEGWVAAADPITREALAFTWPVSAMPYAGVWISQGGHRGYSQIALEATNAWGDCLNESVEQFGKYGSLDAGKSLEFDIWTSVCGGIDNVARVTPAGTYIQKAIGIEGSKIVGEISAPVAGTIEIVYEPLSSLPLPVPAEYTVATINVDPKSAAAISADATLPGKYTVTLLGEYGQDPETLAVLEV